MRCRTRVTLQFADLLASPTVGLSPILRKPTMERAARLFDKTNYSRKFLSEDAIIRGVWPAAVGKVIARHTCSLKKVRTTLVVEMEDAVWHKQLFALRSQIVARLQQVMGNQGIETVEFRVARPAVPRQVGKATELHPAAGALPALTAPDEADEIQDPVLKKIYRLSRKRATA